MKKFTVEDFERAIAILNKRDLPKPEPCQLAFTHYQISELAKLGEDVDLDNQTINGMSFKYIDYFVNLPPEVA